MLASDAASITQFAVNMKRLSGLFLVGLLVALCPAQVPEPDDQYLRIFSLMEQADSLDAKGQAGRALAKYQEAQAALLQFQKGNPRWNANVVSYRLNQLAEK